ncbi:MAG: response regulator [Planctomycetia bacterium]|nr:response regulator [Planctomycetia bacterium]
MTSPFGLAGAYPHWSEREFRRMLETLPVGAYTCDRTGALTFFNRAASRLWGREPRSNDPAQRFCGSVQLHTPDGAPLAHDDCWLARALREDRAFDGRELIIERPDGSRRTVLTHASPLHDERGQLLGAVNVLVDITERQAVETCLREADRRKDEFLAILAHELRNPLAPIRNGLQLLRLDGANPATLERACTLMERQLFHMVRLIDDLMDVSRITCNKLVLRRERVELAAVVRSAVEAVRPVIEAAGHELRVRLPVQPVYLDADLTRLAQVFSNLLNNAAKYMEPGGSIQLQAEPHEAEVIVRVRDGGVGIPTDMLPRIFEIFTQVDRTLERAQGGLGIGLSLARGLVEMHGGSIEAHSAGPGQGSEFVVRLPLLALGGGDAPPGDAGRSRPDAGADGRQRRILVVDDNRDSAISLSTMLELLSNEVHTAHDGLAAVEAAAAFQPEVIFLDIGLPKLNGYDAARRIRELPGGRSIFLIALTGWGQDEDRRRSAEAGFNLHLVKPMDPTAIENLLAGLRPA